MVINSNENSYSSSEHWLMLILFLWMILMLVDVLFIHHRMMNYFQQHQSLSAIQEEKQKEEEEKKEKEEEEEEEEEEEVSNEKDTLKRLTKQRQEIGELPFFKSMKSYDIYLVDRRTTSEIVDELTREAEQTRRFTLVPQLNTLINDSMIIQIEFIQSSHTHTCYSYRIFPSNRC